MSQDRPLDSELINLRDGPDRLETEQDFQREEELCFGDIDFDIYEDDYQTFPTDGHAPYGLNQSRLLTPDGEVLLFRRLCFLKIRGEALKSTLKTGKPSPRKLREIEENDRQFQQTRNDIAQANLRLVASVARRLSSSQDDFDEMFAEGNTILLYAIDKFDYTRGYRFSTYLTHAVSGTCFASSNADRSGRPRRRQQARSSSRKLPVLLKTWTTSAPRKRWRSPSGSSTASTRLSINENSSSFADAWGSTDHSLLKRFRPWETNWGSARNAPVNCFNVPC